MTRWLWSAVHNGIAHPLMVALPRVWGDALHDWTAAKAFGPPARFTRKESEKK